MEARSGGRSDPWIILLRVEEKGSTWNGIRPLAKSHHTEEQCPMSIHPFTVHTAQATLDDLHDRLSRTRWPDEVEGAGWDYGTNLDYLRILVDYWQHAFDWRAQE